MSYADIAQFSLSILPILAIIFLAWKEYRSGSSRLRKDINEDYRERNSQLEEEIKKLREEVHKVNIQMMEFKATIIEKDKHIESLTKLIENRNPELVEILQELKNKLK